MTSMDVTETLLPGVGIRYEILTRSGTKLGLVAHRDRHVEVVVYSGDDPDESAVLVKLTRDEAEAVADILGAPRIAERFADLTREIPGLVAAQIDVAGDSGYADQTLADTRARTRTGASIVALVRGTDVIVSPEPTQQLRKGDVLVVLGTEDALEAMRDILGPGSDEH
jgi:TrkA domain protein